MADCDYCGASFDGEDAYLDHLAAEHEGELGSIDQRRVADRADDDGGIALGPVVLGGLVVFGLALAVYATLVTGGGGSGADGIEAQPLDESGDADRLTDVEQFSSQGNQHVDQGTQIDYERIPPLSGPHYTSTTDAGFYEETPPLGELVHTLEHGAVVIYYDPAETTDEANESMRQFAAEHTGTWQSVVAVPNPNDNPEATYVLTAWNHRLYMDEYDPETVHAFLSEYLGRGPENPVR